MSVLTRILEDIRKAWRPVTCMGIAGTMFVQGIFIPVYQTLHGVNVTSDLTGLSLLISAVAATFAVREWGKAKGNP